jgi:hypothetical protein
VFKHLLLICKVVTGVLALLLLLEIKNGWQRSRPLSDLVIPEVPHLAGAPTNQANASAVKPTTNLTVQAKGSNATASGTSTNSKPIAATNKTETNGANEKIAITSTNSVSTTNAVVSTPTLISTNAGSVSNVLAVTNLVKGTNLTTGSGSNATNRVTGRSTNIPPPSVASANMIRPGMPGMPGGKGPELPPLIQARVDKITQSEILGSVVRPMPMGLLGVAGNYAFMRAANGQTGMIKEGEELGGLKLLKIGVNRVLIEQDGQKKELMIFSGFGSETLLPKLKETTNETAKTK